MIATTRRRVVIATAVGALGLGALGATAAVAETPSPSSTTAVADSTTKRVGAEKGERKRIRHLARAVHAQAVVKKKDGSHVTIVQQRGQVTAIDSDSITVKSSDGYTATYRLDGETRFVKNREKADRSAIKTGDQVLLFGVKSGDAQTAKLVAVPGKPKD